MNVYSADFFGLIILKRKTTLHHFPNFDGKIKSIRQPKFGSKSISIFTPDCSKQSVPDDDTLGTKVF
jgi:hypothetical protein